MAIVPEVFQRSMPRIIMTRTKPNKKITIKDIYKQNFKYVSM